MILRSLSTKGRGAVAESEIESYTLSNGLWTDSRSSQPRPTATATDVGLVRRMAPGAYDGSGIDVCREIRSRHPEIACLMLTSFADDEALAQTMLAGAAGYVLKQILGNELTLSRSLLK